MTSAALSLAPGRSDIVRLLRLSQVLDKLGISRSTLYRLEDAGILPKRRRISENAVGWVEEELDEFIASRPPPPSKDRAQRNGASGKRRHA